MSENKFEKGPASAALHFFFGAIVGAIVFGFVVWMMPVENIGLYVTAAGATVFGVSAAVWRGRFWAALGNNPLFKFWRALTGSR